MCATELGKSRCARSSRSSVRRTSFRLRRAAAEQRDVERYEVFGRGQSPRQKGKIRGRRSDGRVGDLAQATGREHGPRHAGRWIAAVDLEARDCAASSRVQLRAGFRRKYDRPADESVTNGDDHWQRTGTQAEAT